jgi:hypothetical protein
VCVLSYVVYYNMNMLQPIYCNPEKEGSTSVFANKKTMWYSNPENNDQNEY